MLKQTTDLGLQQSQSEVAQQAKMDGGLFHVASLMDLCHLKHSELANITNHATEIGAPGATNAKDDGGYNEVFTEQGASASQMAAAKCLRTISRNLGVTGEANDAVSTCTQVHLSEASRLLRLRENEAHKNG